MHETHACALLILDFQLEIKIQNIILMKRKYRI